METKIAKRTITPLPDDLGGWKSNGWINPLITDEATLRRVAGDEFHEAMRHIRIHLSTYRVIPDTTGYGQKLRGAALGCDWEESLAPAWDHFDDGVAVRTYFLQRRTPFWKQRRDVKPPLTDEYRTIAQLVAKAGGTDSMAKCQDFEDLVASLRLVGSYNEFNPETAIKHLQKARRRRYYGAGNPNDGSDAFEYHIAWEYSLAIYVTLDLHRVLSKDGNGYEEYSADDFVHDMAWVGRLSKADEYSLVSKPGFRPKFRMWWD